MNKRHTLEDLANERELIEQQLGTLKKTFNADDFFKLGTARAATFDLELRAQVENHTITRDDYMEIQRRALQLARTELVELANDPKTMPIARMAAYQVEPTVIAEVHSLIPAAEYAARMYALGVDWHQFGAYAGYKPGRAIQRHFAGEQAITNDAYSALVSLEKEADAIYLAYETKAIQEGEISIPRVPTQRTKYDPEVTKGVVPETVHVSMAGLVLKAYPDTKVVYYSE